MKSFLQALAVIILVTLLLVFGRCTKQGEIKKEVKVKKFYRIKQTDIDGTVNYSKVFY